MKKDILIFLTGFLIFIFCMSVVIIIENTLPTFKEEDINITIFDTCREKYNEYPDLKDFVVTAYTKDEKDAFISVRINATNKDMKRFDKTRESEVNQWLFVFARSIKNPYKLDLLITISNERQKPKEEIIYSAHIDWNSEYDIPEFPSVERTVKYDHPLG